MKKYNLFLLTFWNTKTKVKLPFRNITISRLWSHLISSDIIKSDSLTIVLMWFDLNWFKLIWSGLIQPLTCHIRWRIWPLLSPDDTVLFEVAKLEHHRCHDHQYHGNNQVHDLDNWRGRNDYISRTTTPHSRQLGGQWLYHIR